jgi:uncharacterized FlaG/YvyC family protein
LEAAKLALKEKRFDDGLRHTKAIAAGTPEAIAVKTLTDEINTEVANVLAERKSAEERSAQDRQLSEQRAAVVRDLQDKLRNLGYDLTVGESDKPEELIITSKDFDQTDQRVRFLSFLRGRTNPATDVCLLGFRVVNLRTSALPLVGFSEKYVLGCF